VVESIKSVERNERYEGNQKDERMMNGMSKTIEPWGNRTERNKQVQRLFKYFFQHQSNKQQARQHVKR
jgi:DNA phosphorothioation-dependent restriction protein DptG